MSQQPEKGRPEWVPSNDVERAMGLAAVADERQTYFQLFAVADLFLPQITGDRSGEQRFLTVHAFDHVFLPVFTSVESLAWQFGHAVDGYVVTTYAELRRKWPNPEWRLAINPGTPIDAYLPVEDLAGAAVGDRVVPTLEELVAASAEEDVEEAQLRAIHEAGDYPDDDPLAALSAAADAGDVYGFMERLLDAMVLVPTTRPAQAEELVDAAFPWRYAPEQTIEVFTSPASLEASHPGRVPYVEVGLSFVLACWPEGWNLSIDPDGDNPLEFGAEQVPWLLGFGPPEP